MLRLVANLAILPEAGHVLAEEDHVAAALQHLLEAHGFEAAEELVLNTVCALTNLSYYQSDPPGFTNKVGNRVEARLQNRRIGTWRGWPMGLLVGRCNRQLADLCSSHGV